MQRSGESFNDGYVTSKGHDGTGEKQARWRESNFVSLAASAENIALKLMEMDDQDKLRDIAKFINDHLKHPGRTPLQRQVALGLIGIGGADGRNLGKKAALAALPNHAYRVEVTTADGQRWGNGVRLTTVEEAQLYTDHHARYDVEGYVTSDIIKCEGEDPLNSIIKGPEGVDLGFMHGTCGSLKWRPLD
jgi:hypothetical protein